MPAPLRLNTSLWLESKDAAAGRRIARLARHQAVLRVVFLAVAAWVLYMLWFVL